MRPGLNPEIIKEAVMQRLLQKGFSFIKNNPKKSLLAGVGGALNVHGTIEGTKMMNSQAGVGRELANMATNTRGHLTQT